MSESKKETKVRIGDLNIQDEYVPVAENITAREAAKMMRDYNIPDLVVVDDSEKPLGIITESILVREILADSNKNPDETKVKAIMKKIEPIDIDDDFLKAANYIAQEKISVLPVVEEGKLVGVLSITDVLLGLQMMQSTTTQDTAE